MRCGFFQRGVGWLVLALACAAGPLRAAALEVATLELPADPALTDEVVLGRHDAHFAAVPEARVRIEGGEGQRQWLRIRLPSARFDAREAGVLRFDRVSLDRIALYAAGDRSVRGVDGFYRSSESGSLGPNSFAFPLHGGGGAAPVFYVAVDSIARTTLTPRWLSESDFHAAERGASGLLGAIYASLLVLMLSSLALGLALRDRVHMHFFVLNGLVLIVLLAVNGHLYRLPGTELLSSWRGNGVYALALSAAAFSLEFTREFLGLAARAARTDAWLARARNFVLLMAALCLLNPTRLASPLQAAAGMTAIAVGVINVVAALVAWRRGEQLARAYCVVWLILSGAIALRIGLSRGWLPQHPVTLYGFQLAMAFGMFLVSVGLADRVMEFRKQRDRVRQQKEQTDASLQREQMRREFADTLRAQLAHPPPQVDLEWLAFHRLLAALKSLLPQRSCAVVTFGYHGRDLTLAEPTAASEHFEALLQARGARLRNLCRTRAPVQLAPGEHRHGDPDASSPSCYAVVPLPIAAPAWGALLIEREPGASFDAEELRLAADFLGLAVAATDEAVSQLELRQQAQVDPLTGACNRRTGDELLRRTLRRAVTEGRPYALLFVDIDHYKRVNDEHGHAVGDECLRRAARTIQAVLGPEDVLVRYGGEEFLVIAPGLAPDDSRALGERIREAVQKLRVQNGRGTVGFTVSIGIAGRLPGETEPQDITERADRALYEAKRSGRNRVQAAPTYGYGASGQDLEPPRPLSL